MKRFIDRSVRAYFLAHPVFSYKNDDDDDDSDGDDDDAGDDEAVEICMLCSL